MNQTNLIATIDLLNTALGFAVFILLVFALPFTSVFIASLGPTEWVYTYIAPALKYKPILIFIAGLFTGFLAKKSPVISSAIVGILGSIIVLIILSLSTTPQNQEMPMSFIAWQGFITFALCTVGGICVSLLRRIKK